MFVQDVFFIYDSDQAQINSAGMLSNESIPVTPCLYINTFKQKESEKKP
jgi:hypothetical protein